MNTDLLALYEPHVRLFKALAHPTRLFLVDQLAQNGEQCVCDLTAVVGADISTVSRHLTQLKAAGLLEDEKRGSMVFYRLRDCRLPQFPPSVELAPEPAVVAHPNGVPQQGVT